MILDFDNFQKINKNGVELNNIRTKNLNIFKEKGFPSKKEENWKYTDLKTILSNNLDKLEIPKDEKTYTYKNERLFKNFEHNQIILVNGNFIKSDFSFEDEKKINIKPLKLILNDKEYFKKIKNYFIKQQNSLAALNNALTNDGIYLNIEDDYSFKKPLIIYNFFNKYSNKKIINNKNLISLGNNSQLSFLEYYEGDEGIKCFYNTSHDFSIKKNAILKKFNININFDNSYNYHLTNVKSYSNSIFENFLLSSGSGFLKNEIHCDLIEKFSSCFINSLIFLNKQQHHELKSNISHMEEDCKSSQLVKSVLLDNSNGTYQGKIYVDEKAQKTNGYQLSKALLLSENSTFNSKPELEIYADDVKCSHGSTTGNLDQNSVFYLMSRGLTKDQAQKMLVEGFLKEAIETITELKIKSLISKLFISKINKTKFEINEN
tara:strand:- start:1626 stop:2924 length:1299 start_codon:yes stop_codon:yes gene_type:complete